MVGQSSAFTFLSYSKNLYFADIIEDEFLLAQENKQEWSVGKLLLSKSAKLRVAAAKTVRNCSTAKSAVPVIEQFLSSILPALKEAKSVGQQIDLLICLRNYFRNDTSKLNAEVVQQLCGMSSNKEKAVSENAYFCLAEVCKAPSQALLLFKSLQKQIFENITSENLRIASYSAVILQECSKDGMTTNFHHTSSYLKIIGIQNFFSFCPGNTAQRRLVHQNSQPLVPRKSKDSGMSSRLPRQLLRERFEQTFKNALSNILRLTICTAKIKEKYGSLFIPKVACFLDFPHQQISAHTASMFLDQVRDSKGNISLTDANTIITLAHLLTSGGAKVTHTSQLTFKFDKEKVSLDSSTNPLLTFLFSSESEQKLQIAKSLAKCSLKKNGGDTELTQYSSELLKFSEVAITPFQTSSPLLGFSISQLVSLFRYEQANGGVSAAASFVQLFEEVKKKSMHVEDDTSDDTVLVCLDESKSNAEVLMLEGEPLVEVSYGLLYIGSAGSVLSNAPVKSDGVFSYFEVLVLDEGSQKTVSVGLASPEHFQNTSHPGWYPHSYAYHADDGNAYQSGENKVFGEAYGSGDVIGCGIQLLEKQIFFTKNGKYLGAAFKDVQDLNLLPCVGLSGPGEHLYLNFGQHPFLWDKDDSSLHSFQPAPLAQDLVEGRAEPPKRSDANFVHDTWKQLIGANYDTWSVLDPALVNSLNLIAPSFGRQVSEVVPLPKKLLKRKKLIKKKSASTKSHSNK